MKEVTNNGWNTQNGKIQKIRILKQENPEIKEEKT